MTGIFQNISDLWLENMVHMGEPGLCGLVCFHTTQVLGFFVSAMPGWVRISQMDRRSRLPVPSPLGF